MGKKFTSALILLAILLLPSSALAGWEYKTVKDLMTDQNNYLANVISKNTQTFSFPYSGGTSALITLLEKGDDILLVGMTVFKGQFECPDKCEITVRLDDAKPETWLAFHGDSATIETIYFVGTKRDYLDLPRNAATAKTAALNMINKIKAAKRVRIRASFVRQGDRVFEFDTSGLEWPRH